MTNLFKVFTLTLLSLTIIACGKNNLADQALSSKSSSIIVGQLDWKNVESLKKNSLAFKNSKAVGIVYLPMMESRCTGFLVSDDIVMTNEHCIPSPAHARGVSVSFDLTRTNSAAAKTYICDEFLANDVPLDYALLRCKGKPGRTYGKIKIDANKVNVGSKLYVVQQNCDYYNLGSDCKPHKKYSIGKVTGIHPEITHDADTLGGSSGSPVFDLSTHKIIGLHHAGMGNNGNGRGIENYAVPFDKIYKSIKFNSPSLFKEMVKNVSTPAKPERVVYIGKMPNKYFSGSLDARKLYRFKMLAGSELRIEVSKGYEIELFTKSMKFVAKSDANVIAGTISQTGKYVFRVVGKSKIAKASKGKFKVRIKSKIQE